MSRYEFDLDTPFRDLPENVQLVILYGSGKARIKQRVFGGEMESRIKEQQLDLFGDRTSFHRWWLN
ncbi:MAG: hypothetical protein V3T55_12150 [Anaerolineales bacterium]